MGSAAGAQPRAVKPRPEESGPQGTMYIRPADVPEMTQMERPVDDLLPNAALIGVGEPFADQKFPIRSSRTTIGGKAGQGNDIVLRDPTVSFVHARIIGEQGRWRVMNLLSTNGTFVNGKKVTDATIRHGDRIRFGAAEFVFCDSSRSQATLDANWYLWGAAITSVLAAAAGVWLLLS